jgi:hypothetical protein
MNDLAPIILHNFVEEPMIEDRAIATKPFPRIRAVCADALEGGGAMVDEISGAVTNASKATALAIGIATLMFAGLASFVGGQLWEQNGVLIQQGAAVQNLTQRSAEAERGHEEAVRRMDALQTQISQGAVALSKSLSDETLVLQKLTDEIDTILKNEASLSDRMNMIDRSHR